MLENREVSELSEAEQRLLSLQEGLVESSGANQTPGLGAVAEDFVQISVPGYSGNIYSRDPRTPEAPSPMMSFASLSRVGSRGGGFEKMSDGKKFSVVLVTKEKGLCLSDIGDGSKFCLRGNCPVASHREAKKFDPSEEGSIVIAKGRDVAFASPALGGAVLPRSVYEEWFNEPKTLEAWQELFKASEQDSNFASSAEFEARLREQQTSEAFKTPSKKKGQQTSFLVSGLETMSLYGQTIETREEEAFLQANPGVLTEVILAVDSGLHKLSKSFGKHVMETQDAVSLLELSTSMLELNKKSVSSLLGSISMMGSSTFQSPTVFGTLSALSRKVEEMDLAPPPVIDLSPIEAKLSAFTEETRRVQRLSIDLTTILSKKVKALDGWRLGGGSIANVPPIQVHQPAYVPAISTARVAPVAVSADSVELAKILERLDFLEGERLTQQLEIQRLTSEGDVDAIKFHGLGLKTLEETAAWIEMNSPDGNFDFSLIPDVYFIYELLSGEGEASQSQMLKTMKDLKQLNLDSEYQAKTLCSFILEVPRFLHGPKNIPLSSVVGESHLGNVPSAKAWNRGQGSTQKQIDTKLPAIRTNFRTLIMNGPMLSNPLVYGVASSALERAISFIINLGTWMNSTYENAHITSRMSEAKAWSLVTQLVRRVFAELYTVRMGTIQTMMTNDKKSMCLHLVWSIFRTHDKMAEFDDLNFENHPAIASEYIKFLACNSGFDMLETLEKDVANVKAEARELGSKVKEAVRKSDASTSVSDTNKRGLADLTKRVDRKVDK